MKQRIDQYTLKNVDYMPDHKDMEPGVLYLSRNWSCVKFLCPCGCGIEVYLPADSVGNHPHLWSYTEQGGIITIAPSVQQRGHCGSHYFIQSNKVVWA